MTTPRSPGSRAGALAALTLAASCAAPDAVAGAPAFFHFDVPTVFYISKSDDHNRVDYGIHLDEHCAPTKDEAVFQYWREFENSPPVRVHTLGMFEDIPYGISEQRTIQRTPNGGVHFMRLRQFEKTPIEIITTKETDGRCTSQARAMINGKKSELTFVYVKLARGFITPNVEFVDVHGRDLETGKEVVERIRR